MAPNMARRIFPTNPDLENILGRMDLDFENFYFFYFLDPKFLDFQVPRFPRSGPGRAGLGRTWLGKGRAWAHQTSVQSFGWVDDAGACG